MEQTEEAARWDGGGWSGGFCDQTEAFIMSAIRRVRFVRHDVAHHRRHYVDEEDVKVILSRLPEELWRRLRKVHFNDKAFGNRRAGYTTTRGRREISLCALPVRLSLSRAAKKAGGAAIFGAASGGQWPLRAIRRYVLYNTCLHEIGHLQIVRADARSPRRKFADETLAQEFANLWRERLWSTRFDHPDPVHNPPSEEEMAAVENHWLESHLEYKKSLPLMQAREWPPACEHLQKALEIYADHSMALAALGDAIYQMSLTKENWRAGLPRAKEVLERACRLDPADAKAHLNLAWTLSDLDEREASRRSFEHAVRLDPHPPFAMAFLAGVLSRWGSHDEAEALFRRILRKKPLWDFPYREYARHLMWRSEDIVEDDTRKAIEVLRRAVELDLKSARNYYYLGLAHYWLGETKEALGYVTEALRLDPELPRAQSLRQKLEQELAHSDEISQNLGGRT